MTNKKLTNFVLVILTGLLISFNSLSAAFAEDKKDLQDIKERLIRMEERMVTKDELKTEINNIRTEIKDVRKELDTKITGGFGLLFTSMIALVGFVLWDRRSALAPAVRKNKELEEREDKMEKVLKEYAKQDAKLADIMKHAGLL